ncbi:MAG: hypothetical protein WBM75_00475 [Polyangiales bacterium]
MIRMKAAGRLVALIALAVAAQSAVVGSVANGDTARSGFMFSGLVTAEPFGVRLLDDALTVPNLSAPAATAVSTDGLVGLFEVADISAEGNLQPQFPDSRFHWPHNLDPSGAPIELRQEHLVPLVRLSF